MTDENEIEALAHRLYDAAVSNAGSPSISVLETARHAAREAVRWRDETRPPPIGLALVPEDVRKLLRDLREYITPMQEQHAPILGRIAAALAQRPTPPPAGLAVVPREPTQRMMEIGAKEYGSFEYMPRAKEVQGWGARANAIYRAMLAAALAERNKEGG